MHTLLDLRGNIPTFIRVTDGKVHDVNMLDEIMPEAGAFYVMDRGYIDFERLFVLTLSSAFFVVRTKSNLLLQRRYSHPVDKSTGVRSDQTVILSSFESASAYPDSLRRVSYFDADTGKRLKFLTNNFTLPALTIAQIYKQRWQVELFFKWIKQHLRIKAFYGTSENAVKTQGRKSAALMLGLPRVRCGSRDCGVPGSFYWCDVALTLRSPKELALHSAHSGAG
jgi:IS4 transposase